MKFIDNLIINFNSKSKLRIYPKDFDDLNKCYKKIKNVFDGILISWCGISITSKSKQLSDKKRTRVYEYCLVNNYGNKANKHINNFNFKPNNLLLIENILKLLK
jgi:hypothetical protein